MGGEVRGRLCDRRYPSEEAAKEAIACRWRVLPELVEVHSSGNAKTTSVFVTGYRILAHPPVGNVEVEMPKPRSG